MRARFGSAWRLAAGTLTVLPAGAVPVVDAPVARGAMLLAPVAVLPLAVAVAGLTGAGAALGWPDLVNGLVGVAVLALGTRALHLDGLADTVDGLGAGGDAERALTVMRRGDVGPMGVVALVIVLGLQATALGALVQDWRSAAAVAVLVCCSRAVLVVACRRGVPAARPSGLGAAVVGTVPAVAVVLTWLVIAGVLALVWPLLGGPGWGGVLAAALTLLAAALLVAWCVRRLGGVTGDVLGASVEVGLTVLLLAGAAG